jgi:hypothetical protein
MSVDFDDEPPEDPASALRLIREQQAEASRQLNPDPRLFMWPWGLAWLIGFGLIFLRFGPDGRVFINLPPWLPLTSLFVLLAVAGVISGLAGAKAFGQVTGESTRRGTWYGYAWFLGYLTMFVILIQVSDQLSGELVGLLWSASAVGLTGILHIAGGAIWLDRALFLLGVWLTVINLAGVLAGPGWHALIVALAGGGGILLAGTVALQVSADTRKGRQR